MSPRKPRPAAPRARKPHGWQRLRLIEACISALHLYGPSRTTVEKVVAIAKMSPGIVRFYFDSKAAMLVASLQFLAAEFEERLLIPVASLKETPVAALELMVDLYLDPDIASPRKVSVWYAFWGEASSRQEYYDICGQKDEGFAVLVRELIERLIVATAQPQLDPDGIALGLIGALEMLWQEIAFRSEQDIDRVAAKGRCMAYLRSIFPGRFPAPGGRTAAPARPEQEGLPPWAYSHDSVRALERAHIFQDAWTAAAHESQLVHGGQFVTLDTSVERMLLVRDQSGSLRALRNCCPQSPHALVTARAGRFTAGIDCRQHGLRFGLDGRRLHGVGPGDLPTLDLESRSGLLFVRAPPQGRGTAMDGVPRLAAEVGLNGLTVLGPASEIRVEADWKIVVERWLETGQPMPPADLGGTASMVWQVALPNSGWSERAYRSLVKCRPGPPWGLQFIAPNQLVELRPDGVSLVVVQPSAPGWSRVWRLDCTRLAPDRAARAAAWVARRLGAYAGAALKATAESVQSGRQCFGYRTAAPTPPAVGWFHRFLVCRIPEFGRLRPPPDLE